MELSVIVVVLKAHDGKRQLLNLLGKLAAEACLAAYQRWGGSDSEMVTLDILRISEICNQVANVARRLSEGMMCSLSKLRYLHRRCWLVPLDKRRVLILVLSVIIRLFIRD